MRIGFYTTPNLLGSDSGDTRYLYEGLRKRFDVSAYAEADVALCTADDVVFLRFTVPIRRAFLREFAAVHDKLIINDPVAQLRYGSKRNLLEFPELTAPTIVSDSSETIRRFAEDHGTIVLKPLDRHVGTGVTRIEVGTATDAGWEAFIAGYIAEYGTPIVQRYLECAEEAGDKRINVFGYEAISAVRTLPAEGSFLSHRALGGTELPATITREDEAILAEVIPFLRKHRIWSAGLDVIGSNLSELNVVNPSMVWRADTANGNSRGLDRVIATLEEYEEARAA